ncbi:MAG TPA: hypothetical protein VF577_04610 [Allosphingosinicella sp.]|jgi:hypothetical protein
MQMIFARTILTAAAFLGLAAGAAAQAPGALPTEEEVRQALADEQGARCGDDDACIARQPAVEVRSVACEAAGEDMASCRYETRAGAAAWRAATSRFRFDIETQLWFIDDGERG